MNALLKDVAAVVEVGAVLNSQVVAVVAEEAGAIYVHG